MLVVKAPLPANAVSRPRLFLTIDPPEIGLGAYHEYAIGPADLPLAPIRPAFRRRLDILIDDRVNAVGPQPVGEPEHPVAMLVTVVAVADENPRHRNVRHGRLFSLSSAIVWSGGCLAKAAVAICLFNRVLRPRWQPPPRPPRPRSDGAIVRRRVRQPP